MAGELALRGGHEVDVAFFQSPLRGNYEVSARLSLNEFREMQLQVAGLASSLKSTNSLATVRNIQIALPDVAVSPPISPGYQAWCDYKVVVKDGHYTSFINGQKLYEADLAEQHDPWLAVLGVAGNSSRAARNVVITGQPQIPAELDLLAPANLNGWLTDYYGSTTGQSTIDWKQEDGILMCERNGVDNLAQGRLKIEDILRYHRPMLEDGEISYEFFYAPDLTTEVEDRTQRVFVNGGLRNTQRTIKYQTHVHPALDRLVCLLEPDGVKIHWLTDGKFDRTGRMPDNRTEVDTSAAGKRPAKMPLKIQDWNAVSFVKGDTLTTRSTANSS